MFNKLLSNLPFNPSLIGHVSFYAKRLKRETSVRRLGFVFIALTMIIQTVAVISPPNPAFARPGNDILPGGAGSQQQIVQYCQQNAFGFGQMIKYFGSNCDLLAGGTVQRISSTTTQFGGQLYSMGRSPYGLRGEVPVNIEGLGGFYMRPLSSWDTHGPSYYTALVAHNVFTGPLIILFDCGNIVIVGPPPAPAPRCSLDNSIYQIDPRCTPCPYNNTIIASNPACLPPKCPQDQTINADNPRCKACPADTSILKDNPACARCPFNENISRIDARCKPCKASEDRSDSRACLVLSKKATNQTQGNKNANGTTANPGDTIEYTLIVKNTGKATVKKFVVEESMADVLEYADIVDLNGGSKSSDNIVKWPAVDIPAQTTIKRIISVRVKNPVPNTPRVPNSGSFDLVMNNVYGNAINIKVSPTVIKTTEQAVGSLPNTGPGESLAIGFGITVVIGYFFARSRVLSKEIDIVREEYVSGGV